MVTGEGTLYPLLSRLKKDGHVTTSWRESESGPPRKYYAITAEGRHALVDFTTQWRRQKLLGILVWPGGLVMVGLSLGLISVGAGRSCDVPTSGAANCTTSGGTSPWVIVALVLITVAPILVGAYLYRSAGRRAAR